MELTVEDFKNVLFELYLAQRAHDRLANQLAQQAPPTTDPLPSKENSQP